MKRYLSLLLILLALITIGESCKQSIATSANNNDEPEIPQNCENPGTLSVLYHQTAAEYRALCYQAFNVARYQLDLRLKETHEMREYAVVVDIDETILDNSPYEARCILDEVSYPEGWDYWMKKSDANAIPGALEFVRYAKSKGVHVFYISNRDQEYLKYTLTNLEKLGFPFAQEDHLFLKRGESSKKERRTMVERQFKVVMLIGDNLADFSDMFENKNIQTRFAATDRFSEKFGTEFIVLPCAIYGDWLKAVYQADASASPEEKADMRRSALVAY